MIKFKLGDIVKEKGIFVQNVRYKVLHCWFEGETGNTYIDLLYLATKYRIRAEIFMLSDLKKKFKDSPYV